MLNLSSELLRCSLRFSGLPENKNISSAPVVPLILTAGQEQPLVEWEYLPPIGPRPNKGFVGLKNAGATCYMNSVLQQVCVSYNSQNIPPHLSSGPITGVDFNGSSRLPFWAAFTCKSPRNIYKQLITKHLYFINIFLYLTTLAIFTTSSYIVKYQFKQFYQITKLGYSSYPPYRVDFNGSPTSTIPTYPFYDVISPYSTEMSSLIPFPSTILSSVVCYKFVCLEFCPKYDNLMIFWCCVILLRAGYNLNYVLCV